MPIHTRLRGIRGLLLWTLFATCSQAQSIAIKAEYVFVELFPQNMQTAFDYAANEILGDALVPSFQDETVDVLLRWRELGWPGPYAATSLRMSRNFAPNDPAVFKDTYYPTALANHLVGADRSDQHDITITLNASALLKGGVEFYLLTDGKAPKDTIDYVTLILHELVHGLGFFSTITANGSYSDIDPPGPSIYDRFVDGILFDDNGKPLRRVPLPNMPEDADRARAVVWPELLWSGDNGRAGEIGQLLFLYAPKEFSDSASVSHIALGQDSLMRPDYRGVNHTLDRITLGVLEDIGWTIREGLVPVAPTVLLLSLGLVGVRLARVGGR